MQRLGSVRSLLFGGILTVAVGVLIGLGGFTFTYARGTSYLSNNPETCANCHIMRDEYEAWTTSSHRNFATCNDCHTPHDPIGKWVTKGVNGFNHGLAFTTGNYPEVIQIRDYNADIVQENCVACHETLVSNVYGMHADADRRCVDCHGNPGHQNRNTR
jgi:cytochrome c nitrite reductase small subunit